MQPIQLPCHCGSLRQASRAMTQLYDQCLSPAGLTITQFGILKMLEAFPGITRNKLAAALVMDSTTMTRTVDGLKRQGWVTTAVSTDRRERPLRLEPSGKAKLVEATPYWESAQQALAEIAAGVDLAAFSRASFQLVEALASAA